MISLRWRITLWYVILTVIALGGFMLVSYQALSESLRREIDNTLIERANHVTDALAVVPNRPIEGISPESTDEFSSPGVYVQIFDEDGTVVARSFNLGAQQLPFTAIDLEHILTGDDFYITTQIGSQSVRLYHRPLRREGITVGVVQVGQSLTGLETTLRRLRLIYAIGTTVVLLFGVVGSRWIARRGLQPVTHVAQTARAIVQAEDLTRRVDYSGPPDEIGTLAATFNDMLNRLQTLFESQHRFLAEAAHELRTPLASVLGNVDLLAKYGDDPNRRGETLAAIQRTGKHIVRLLDDLLLLAQAEAGWHLQLRPLAADDIFLEVYEAMIPIAGNTVLQLEKCDPAQIQGDPDRLRQVFFNLIHNACKHSGPRGTVTLRLWLENDCVWIQICNTGPGIAPEALKRVYEPFFRETGASSLSGTGLGLTIVRWIVQEHQGSITVKSEPGAGTAVTLSFPLYPS